MQLQERNKHGNYTSNGDGRGIRHRDNGDRDHDRERDHHGLPAGRDGPGPEERQNGENSTVTYNGVKYYVDSHESAGSYNGLKRYNLSAHRFDNAPAQS